MTRALLHPHSQLLIQNSLFMIFFLISIIQPGIQTMDFQLEEDELIVQGGQ